MKRRFKPIPLRFIREAKGYRDLYVCPSCAFNSWMDDGVWSLRKIPSKFCERCGTNLSKQANVVYQEKRLRGW